MDHRVARAGGGGRELDGERGRGTRCERRAAGGRCEQEVAGIRAVERDGGSAEDERRVAAVMNGVSPRDAEAGIEHAEQNRRGLTVGHKRRGGVGAVVNAHVRQRIEPHAVGEDHGVVFQAGVVVLEHARGIHELAGGGGEVVVVADEEEVVIRIPGVLAGHEAEGFPFFAERIHIAGRGVDVHVELREVGYGGVHLAEHVHGFGPGDRRDAGLERVAGAGEIAVHAFAVVGAVEVRRAGEFREDDGLEDRSARRAAAIAVAGEDEKLVIVERDDGTLRGGAVHACGAADVGHIGVHAGKLDDILRDGIVRRVGAGDVIDEQAGIGAALIAAAAVLNGGALQQAKEARAVRALAETFHALVDAAAIERRV